MGKIISWSYINSTFGQSYIPVNKCPTKAQLAEKSFVITASYISYSSNQLVQEGHVDIRYRVAVSCSFYDNRFNKGTIINPRLVFDGQTLTVGAMHDSEVNLTNYVQIKYYEQYDTYVSLGSSSYRGTLYSSLGLYFSTQDVNDGGTVGMTFNGDASCNLQLTIND